MGRNRQQRPTFTRGDFVFAKMKGYRPWPARVLGLHGTPFNTKFNVFFYGTCNTAKVSPANIFDFATKKQRLGAVHSRNTARNAGFRSAMAHIRRAFERPEHDFVYYQVLARTKGPDEDSEIYEMVSSASDSDADSVDSTEPHQSKAKNWDSEETDEFIPEDEEEAHFGKKPEQSMPLLDDQDDGSEKAQVFSSIEKELRKLDGDEDSFCDEDSKAFEFEDNPLDMEFEDSGNVEHFSHSIEEELQKMEDDEEDSEFLANQNGEDEDSEDDHEPMNLSYDHIIADEYPTIAS